MLRKTTIVKCTGGFCEIDEGDGMSDEDPADAGGGLGLQLPVSVYCQSTGNNGEDGDRGEPDIRSGPTGLDLHTEERAFPEEADGTDGGAVSRKRGAPSTSDGSGWKRAKCEHGTRREKNKCKECGGGAFCPHGRRKQNCKDCGGSAICPHGRRKSECKVCGGSAICPHGRIKYKCTDRVCGGSAICPHGRIKYKCTECRETCSHGTKMYKCKMCRLKAP